MGVLLAYGPALYSHVGPSGSVSGWVSVGTSPTGVVPGVTPAHNDGMLAIYSAANEITAAFAVDLGVAKTPDLVGFFNHNLTTGTVRVQASDSPNFAVLVVDVAVTIASPNFWKDLRGVTPRTARYWRGSITGNAAAVKLGEFVVAAATPLQSYQWGYDDTTDYLERTFGVTEHGVLHRRKQAIAVRSRTVRWVGIDSVEDTLRAVALRVNTIPGPVIFVPDDTVEADIWFLDWQDAHLSTQVLDNRRDVTMTLQEQSPGSLI